MPLEIQKANPIMIIIAAILSGLLRHWPDLGVILFLLIMNALVGFREEYQAGNAIAALKEKLAVQARVKRDNEWILVPSREVVPGDVIRAPGDIFITGIVYPGILAQINESIR